jgi:c-di-GMP-binding flagellar brake protein YcgR
MNPLKPSGLPATAVPSDSPKPVKAKSRRRDPRISRDSQIVLCCVDRQGRQQRLRARAVDVSKTGILVQAEEPVQQGAIVFLQTASFTALGKASVRHCTQKGMKYRIGLYLPDPLPRDI